MRVRWAAGLDVPRGVEGTRRPVGQVGRRMNAAWVSSPRFPFNTQPPWTKRFMSPSGGAFGGRILVWKVRVSRVSRPVTCLASQSHSQVWEAKPVTAGAMSLLVSRASCREEAWLLVDGFYSGCSHFRAASAAPLTPTPLVLPERRLSFILCAVGIQAERSPRLRQETCVISACLATER